MTQATATKTKGTILWLDKDKTLMESFRLRVEIEGYEVLAFGNFQMQEALECLQSEKHIDLIIAEPSFPLREEEEEFFDALREQHPDIPPLPENALAQGAAIIHAALVLRPEVPVFVLTMHDPKEGYPKERKITSSLEKLGNVVRVGEKTNFADTALLMAEIKRILGEK